MSVVKTVRSGDLAMRAAVFGTGPKNLIILPGTSLVHVTDTPEPVEARYHIFCQDYTVYVPDRRENMPEDYSIRDMANDTYVILRALGLEEANVFGASQGGMIAQLLALDHPDFVSRLVLGSTAARLSAETGALKENWIRLAYVKDYRALTEIFLKMFSDRFQLQARDALLSSCPVYSDEDLHRFVQQLQARLPEDLPDRLSAISCPTLVLGAEGDTVTGPAAARQLADAIGCECYLYGDGYNHAVFDEAPDYPERIFEFLQR